MIVSSDTAIETVDTNILIYAADPAAGFKHKRAITLLRELDSRGSLVLSAQVLNEFYVTATRPQKPPSLSHEEASGILRDLTKGTTILALTASTTFRALDAVADHGLSFWDALIWAAAK